MNQSIKRHPDANAGKNQKAVDDQDNPDAKSTLPKETARNVNQGIRNITIQMPMPERIKCIVEGSKVIFDGSKSKDKGGKIESYRWQQITDPKVALDNTNSNQAHFISPTVPITTQQLSSSSL